MRCLDLGVHWWWTLKGSEVCGRHGVESSIKPSFNPSLNQAIPSIFKTLPQLLHLLCMLAVASCIHSLPHILNAFHCPFSSKRWSLWTCESHIVLYNTDCIDYQTRPPPPFSSGFVSSESSKFKLRKAACDVQVRVRVRWGISPYLLLSLQTSARALGLFCTRLPREKEKRPSSLGSWAGDLLRVASGWLKGLMLVSNWMEENPVVTMPLRLFFSRFFAC